ncbi:MAG TPA: two-component regulator propeller domain-containing protein [Bryobacteraceae bacterium]|nr:two-component regulator propeller domain-containing protein [Bryobacteraceae bacterium]
MLCLAGTAQALDPNRTMSQYIRDQWSAEQGFPGGAVYAIAQTNDGYLWIGAENGLVRFDGLSFRLYNHTNTPVFPTGPVLGLTTDADGNLWIRPQEQGLLRYRGGAFEIVFPLTGGEEAVVTAMGRDSHGDALFARANRLFRYGSGKFTLLTSPSEPTRLVISMAQTRDGKVWMGTRDAGLFYLSGVRVTSVALGLPDRKVNSLQPAGERDLWIGTDNGIARWNGTELTRAGTPRSLDHVQILGISIDHDSNIWVASAHGLSRINSAGPTVTEERVQPVASGVSALFEDREGDFWVGNSRGIERFRDTLFLTYDSSGTPGSKNDGPLYVDAAGRTWFAPSDGGLFWVKGDTTGRISDAGLDNDVVYSISGGDDELWIARQKGGLTHLRSRGSWLTNETYTARNGLAQNSVYVVHRNLDGTVWAGTLGAGVSRFQNGRFTTFTTANGLASNTVSAIEESSDGSMWFATPNGLSAFAGDRWRVYTGRDGLPPGGVNCLLEDSSGVLWIGTADGLAFLHSGPVQIPRAMPESLHEPVLGITEDRTGWLWIATSNHVLRLNRDKLLAGALADSDVREFTSEDGLHGGGVNRQRSVVRDPLGRIWFSLNNGISVVDPARLNGNSVPAPIHMQTVSADGTMLNLEGPLRIPSARRRVTFSYIGLSLSMPSRIKYRYMLDGFDHGWSEPVAAREAVYTNLSPGFYRFQVMARNKEGVWNTEGAAVQFEIQPALWQTFWFQLSCVLASIATALALYRYRLRQLTRQLNVRFEERLAERTRIAQELHDTLLQGFLSASMQLHVTVDGLPEGSPAKPPLNRVLQLIGQVTEEARNTLRGLRSHEDHAPDLEQAFSRIRQELAIQDDIKFRVIVEGRPRPLHPLLRDEVYRIGREALVNAFRHSHARQIEAALEYGSDQLRIQVRDNGCGIDPEVLRSGRDGHWGLPGMRERAERIGARLIVWSSAAAGTEVELSIPGHIAFAAGSRGGLLKWFARFYPGRGEAGASDIGGREKIK